MILGPLEPAARGPSPVSPMLPGAEQRTGNASRGPGEMGPAESCQKSHQVRAKSHAPAEVRVVSPRLITELAEILLPCRSACNFRRHTFVHLGNRGRKAAAAEGT